MVIQIGFIDQELPALIRDAAKVTRNIGLRYLCVDSMCILQDDENEKIEQIALMHKIFRGSAITIVSAIANNTTEGFLHPRHEYSSVRVKVRWEDNVWNEMVLVPEIDCCMRY